MKLVLPEVFTPLLDVRARYKAYYSGRGCGKSTAFAIAAIMRATKEPIRILCAREIQKSIRESVKHDLDKVIYQAGLGSFFVSTESVITGANGSMFIFDGLQKAHAIRMQSLSDIDLVWVEEASTISQTSLDTLIPTIRKEGSEIWFAWNPRSPRDPVDKMFRQTDIADHPVPPELEGYYDKWAIVQPVTGLDLKHLFPHVLRTEMERDRTRNPDKFRHVWMGEYAHRSDATVFRNWKVGDYEVPKDARPYYGADWGFSVDPTVLVRVYVFPEERVLYIDAEVGGVGIDIDKTPALFDSIDDIKSDLHPRLWPIMADSARPETISYMINHGYSKIERARKGPGSIEEGIEFINSFDTIINPACKRVIDEFTFYSYDRDKLTDEVLPKLVDDHNHTVDAVRYALESVRRAIPLGTFGEVVREKRTYFGDPNTNASETRNPALSPGSGNQGGSKGLCW